VRKHLGGDYMPQKCALIVDDEPLITFYLNDVMSGLGYTVDVAGTDSRARAIVSNKTPDIALLDVNLAGKHEGIELAKWLRKVHFVPVVFITGNTDRHTWSRIDNEIPGAPILSKPAMPDEIANAVRRVISESGARWK
jgi:DNA-binding response OmpR family regulator